MFLVRSHPDTIGFSLMIALDTTGAENAFNKLGSWWNAQKGLEKQLLYIYSAVRELDIV